MTQPNVYCLTCGEVYDLEKDFFQDHKVVAAVLLQEHSVLVVALCKHNFSNTLDWLAIRPLDTHFIGYATSFNCLSQLLDAISFGREIIDYNDLLTMKDKEAN